MSFEKSHGWLWKIRKLSSVNEYLLIRCILNPNGDVSSSPDTRENLDAIEIENGIKVLHLGTEDPDALYSRAEMSDCMPNRFVTKYLDDRYALSFTNYLNYGFETEIPELKENEEVYFQYLSAMSTIKQSVSYPNELDVSTWFAVEQTKDFLLSELGVKFSS